MIDYVNEEELTYIWSRLAPALNRPDVIKYITNSTAYLNNLDYERRGCLVKYHAGDCNEFLKSCHAVGFLVCIHKNPITKN